MFKGIKSLPADPILKLTQLCKNDPRSEKIDVGVGIFMNEKQIVFKLSELESELDRKKWDLKQKVFIQAIRQKTVNLR